MGISLTKELLASGFKVIAGALLGLVFDWRKLRRPETPQNVRVIVPFHLHLQSKSGFCRHGCFWPSKRPLPGCHPPPPLPPCLSVTAGVSDAEEAAFTLDFFKRYELINSSALGNLAVKELANLQDEDELKGIPRWACRGAACTLNKPHRNNSKSHVRI